MLTNRKNNFQNPCITDTGLSDFHTTTFKFYFNKLETKIIPYRDYKYFRMIYLDLSLLQEMGIYKITMVLILFWPNVKLFLKARYLISKSLLELIAVHLLTKPYLRIQWRLSFAIVIRCSRLRLWLGYFTYFKITHVVF